MSTRLQPMPTHCKSCLWEGPRIDAEGPCPACGGSLNVGRITSTMMRRGVGRKASKTHGTFGEVSEDLQAYIDAALAKNRAEAMR